MKGKMFGPLHIVVLIIIAVILGVFASCNAHEVMSR